MQAAFAALVPQTPPRNSRGKGRAAVAVAAATDTQIYGVRARERLSESCGGSMIVFRLTKTNQRPLRRINDGLYPWSHCYVVLSLCGSFAEYRHDSGQFS